MTHKPTAILLLCLLACSITIRPIEARRSRIDLPIPMAAEAPHSDNLATASGSESAEIRVPAPAGMAAAQDVASPSAVENKEVTEEHQTVAEEVAEPAAVEAVESAEPSEMDAEGSVSEMEEECDPDMIGFEIVTG